jgi:spermidine/putrescine transport system substrate-binding protein
MVRIGIVALWIALMFGALYWPKWGWLHYDERTLNVFAWGDILEPSVIADFEKETGIKVRLSYYSSNEELLVKLKATRGAGYDLIIPSDYAVQLLVQEGLLKELDTTRLSFWKEINPQLLGHAFDPENRFSIPFEWEVFGFGVDTHYFGGLPNDPSWKLIFDKETVSYKIAMINDPLEAVLFSAFYLYGPLQTLSPAQTHAVRELLIQQRTWVEAYADFRADYFLATKNCPVAVASSSYIWRTMRLFPFVSFVVPKEGTFITIENLCIPAATDKEELVYRLIHYLYRPESVAAHHKTFGFFPATIGSLPGVDLDPVARALILTPPEEFRKFHFFQMLLPEQEVRNLWVEVKTSGFYTQANSAGSLKDVDVRRSQIPHL